ncbi:MAG: restriction endonuclease fold toxin [Jatrophihabitantaceae bacterium]
MAAARAMVGKKLPASSTVSRLSLTVLDRTALARLGLSAPAFSIARTDGVTSGAQVALRVPTSVLDGLYGADYASRVRWVLMPPTGSPTAKNLTPVTTVADRASSAIVLTPTVSAPAMVLAPMAGPVSSAGTGIFAATPLKPSSSWQVSAQTGDFSWTYPMAVPPAAAGPQPSLALSYDSGSVDGETGSTNNQPSTVGEGWSLTGDGFIERKYVSCSEDDGVTGAVASSGDLCWKTDNAVMSFGGHSGNLVKDSTGTWRLQDDDGSRVEHLTSCVNGTWDNDCWRLTTTDGTQYYFGMNQLPGWSTGHSTTNSAWTVPVYGNDPGEPGYNGDGTHAGTFASEAKTQAWRWNLDYVVDPHGNAQDLFYSTETNRYAQNGSGATAYVRGGEVARIDYGLRSNAIFTANAASDKVLFTYVERCNTGATCSSSTPTSMPDVPWDQNCTAAPCTGKVSPTFWSEYMLKIVSTQARTAATVYSNVDDWTLGHSYFNPGDGTAASLALTQVQQVASVSGTNTVGTSITMPATKFQMQANDNRVWDTTSGLAHLAKYRIYNIITDSGANITVGYHVTDPACTYNYGQATLAANPDSDTHACFQQWWTPAITPPQPVRKDLFYKYVVQQVDEDPSTGGTDDVRTETQYVYTGSPAWRYDNSPLVADKYRTWSDYAGYSSVEVRKGSVSAPNAQQATDYTFYQGMDGDHMANGAPNRVATVTTDGTTVTDSRWLAGRTRDTQTPDPAGSLTPLSDVLSTPWVSLVTANDGTLQARIVNDGQTRTTVPVSTGGTRATVTTNSYDNNTGLILSASDATSDAGSTCTRTSYAQNTSSWLLAYPSELTTVGQDCSTSPSLPADAISDIRTSYDGGAWGAAPTQGNPSLIQKAISYTGTTPNFLTTTSSTTYDALGRLTKSTDELNRVNTTSFTPAGNGPLTSTSTVTDLGTGGLNWPSVTTYNPARGTEITFSDQNAHVTNATYDALGRRSQVWLPDRTKATYPSSPSTSYAYTVSATAPLTVATTILTTTGATVTSYALYDGLGRARQTQSWAEAKNTGGTHILAGTVVTDTFYDSAGRVSLTNSAYYTPSVNPSTTLFTPQTTIPGQVQTTYDAAGRKTADIQLVNGSEVWRTSYAYQGADRTDMTPSDGGTPTSTFVNSRGKTGQLWEFDATAPTGTPLATAYGYDARGDMTSMRDAATHNNWSWKFDVLGRQISATDPDTGTTTSTYDNGGRLTSATDAGRVTATGQQAAPVTLAYSYDHADRKTDEYLGSTSGTLLAHWTYDSLSKGKLTSSTRYVGNDAYTSAVLSYDVMDRPTETTTTIPTDPAVTGSLAGTYEQDFGYNLDGSLSTVDDYSYGGLPAEELLTKYTGLGNPIYYAGFSTYLADDTFTSNNLISQENLTDGNSELDRTFYYTTGTNRLSRLLTTTSANTNFTAADHSYTYTNSGQLAEDYGISDAGTDVQCFNYDHLQDLTQAWTPTPTPNTCAAPTATSIGGLAPYWTSYGYDQQSGNRTSVTNHSLTGGADSVATYNYPAAGAAQPHIPTSITHTGATSGSDTYTADPAGDTTSRPGQTLTFTPEGKLATATSGTNTVTNIYDADGNLLLKLDPAAGNTAYLGDTQLHTPAGAPGGTVTGVRTYTVLGTPIAERSTTIGGPANGTLMWLNADRNNTVADEANNLTLATTHRYTDPFGNPRGSSTPTWTSDHTFLNAPTDPTTATVHLGARDYDPRLGRFLTADPILDTGNPQSINGYAYGSNNPVGSPDPTGLHTDDAADPLHPGQCDVGKCGAPDCPNSSGGQHCSDPSSLSPPAPGAGITIYKPAVATRPPLVSCGKACDGPGGAQYYHGQVFPYRGPDCNGVPEYAQCFKEALDSPVIQALVLILSQGRDDPEISLEVPINGGMGDLVGVPNKIDQDAIDLAARLGGVHQVRFANDPSGAEFDAVSDKFIGQAKPGGQTLGKAFREQAKRTFEVALQTNRTPYFHFDGEPGAGVRSALYRYADRYGSPVVIDTDPFN